MPSPRAIGQMLFMGWDGTEVTPQLRHLIVDHHIGSILLTAKNLKCTVCRLAKPQCCPIHIRGLNMLTTAQPLIRLPSLYRNYKQLPIKPVIPSPY
jgi:hypothetical protein